MVGAALLLATNGPALSVCAAEGWWIAEWGEDARTYMSVTSGLRCPLDSMPGGVDVINSIQVSREPSNGTAVVGDADVIWYQSRQGYTGEDSFEFTVVGSGLQGRGTSRVGVRVRVEQ
jgi:hypothetical protein